MIEKLGLNTRLAAAAGAPGGTLTTDITFKYILNKMLRVESQRSSSLIDINVYAQEPALAAEIEAELRARDPSRGVAFVIEDGLSAVADPRLARTVLENLLENAWKFTSQRENARIELALVEDGSFVVRDNGAGFESAYAEKLFVPFERLHREDEFTGNGIGLATVQRIVHRHGGQLRGEGTVGDGAAFYFDFGGGEEIADEEIGS